MPKKPIYMTDKNHVKVKKILGNPGCKPKTICQQVATKKKWK